MRSKLFFLKVFKIKKVGKIDSISYQFEIHGLVKIWCRNNAYRFGAYQKIGPILDSVKIWCRRRACMRSERLKLFFPLSVAIMSVSALSQRPFLPTFDRFNERICIKSETFSSFFQLCLH